MRLTSGAEPRRLRRAFLRFPATRSAPNAAAAASLASWPLTGALDRGLGDWRRMDDWSSTAFRGDMAKDVLRGVVGLLPRSTTCIRCKRAAISSSSRPFSVAATVILRIARWIESRDGALRESFVNGVTKASSRRLYSLQRGLPKLFFRELLLQREQVFLELLNLGADRLARGSTVQSASGHASSTGDRTHLDLVANLALIFGLFWSELAHADQLGERRIGSRTEETRSFFALRLSCRDVEGSAAVSRG